MKKVISFDGVNTPQTIKIYYCDKCRLEVYSLLCRRMIGIDYDICDKCYEEEVKGNVE